MKTVAIVAAAALMFTSSNAMAALDAAENVPTKFTPMTESLADLIGSGYVIVSAKIEREKYLFLQKGTSAAYCTLTIANGHGGYGIKLLDQKIPAASRCYSLSD